MEDENRAARGRRRPLLAMTTGVLLAGCSWFGGDAPVGKARPGADRQIAPTGTLPAAHPAGQAGQSGVTPADETRTSTPAIGSIVAPTGGQKAQKEAEEKAAVERDARERERELERRAERDAANPATETPQPLPQPVSGGALPPPSSEVSPASEPPSAAPKP